MYHGITKPGTVGPWGYRDDGFKATHGEAQSTDSPSFPWLIHELSAQGVGNSRITQIVESFDT